MTAARLAAAAVAALLGAGVVAAHAGASNVLDCRYGSIPVPVVTHYGWGPFRHDRTVIKCVGVPLGTAR